MAVSSPTENLEQPMTREKQPLENDLPSELRHLIEKRVGSRRDSTENVDEQVEASRPDGDRRQAGGRREDDGAN